MKVQASPMFNPDSVSFVAQKKMISHIAAAFLLLVAFAIHGTEQKNRGCSRLIHDVHLNRLLDLVSFFAISTAKVAGKNGSEDESPGSYAGQRHLSRQATNHSQGLFLAYHLWFVWGETNYEPGFRPKTKYGDGIKLPVPLVNRRQCPCRLLVQFDSGCWMILFSLPF